MTPATVLVAVFFLIPTLLITYIRFLDIEGSNFVDNPSVWLPSNIPLSILGWVAIVLVYYDAFAVPGFVIGRELFYPAVFADWCGEGASLIRAYGELGIGYGEPGASVLPEALLTTLITTLAFLALPRRHRRPLW